MHYVWPTLITKFIIFRAFLMKAFFSQSSARTRTSSLSTASQQYLFLSLLWYSLLCEKKRSQSIEKNQKCKSTRINIFRWIRRPFFLIRLTCYAMQKLFYIIFIIYDFINTSYNLMSFIQNFLIFGVSIYRHYYNIHRTVENTHFVEIKLFPFHLFMNVWTAF